jgi:uncharacterized protein
MKKKTQKTNKNKLPVTVGVVPKFFNHKVFVAPSQVHGRGVYAAQSFQEGEVIEIAPAIRIETNPVCLDHTELKHYVFGNDDEETLLALGYVSLYNHSINNQNARFDVHYDVVVVSATRHIDQGEELFVNYGWEKDDMELLMEGNLND